MQNRKGGRPSLGERDRRELRLPVDLSQAAEAFAGARGTSFNAAVIALLTEALSTRGLLDGRKAEVLPLGA